MHGINKKTLMWYDETGLFRPAAIHPENGYRYYSYHQSSILETILLLRELGVSIGEIQSFMQNRSAASLEQLLQEKIDELDRTLAHLRSVRKTLAYGSGGDPPGGEGGTPPGHSGHQPGHPL